MSFQLFGPISGSQRPVGGSHELLLRDSPNWVGIALTQPLTSRFFVLSLRHRGWSPVEGAAPVRASTLSLDLNP